MNAEIRRADPSREFLTHENCFILELANDSGDPDVSIARARVVPGVTTEWHSVFAVQPHAHALALCASARKP